jgi:hypothetical protein
MKSALRNRQRGGEIVHSSLPASEQQATATFHEAWHLLPVILFLLIGMFIGRFAWKPFESAAIKVVLKARHNCPYPVYLSTLTLMKNEGDYLLEWLEYHLLVGVERFFLIDNDSRDNSTAILQPYITLDIVRLRTCVDAHPQLAVYNTVLPTLRNESYWVAIMDIDEFLVPLESHCIPPILHSLEREVGVYVHWVIYGWNRKQKKEDGLVIERFRAHASWQHKKNSFGKLISRPREVIQAHVHVSRYRSGYAVNLCHARSANHLSRNRPCYQRMRINHYWTKSRAEWMQKVARGQVYRYDKYDLSLFALIDDVIQNDTVMDWYIPRVKANLVAANTYPPCHIVADPHYDANLQAAYQSKNQTGNLSWITAVIQFEK